MATISLGQTVKYQGKAFIVKEFNVARDLVVLSNGAGRVFTAHISDLESKNKKGYVGASNANQKNMDTLNKFFGGLK